MSALLGWSGPCSKSGRLLTTLLKPARAASAMASGVSCGATQTSGATGRTGRFMALLCQSLFHGGRNLAHLGLASQPRLGGRHHAAHVGWARGAELADDGGDGRTDLLGRQSLRQVGLEHLDLGALLV